MEFKELCQNVIEYQGSSIFFQSFSGGKDSIATFLRVRETGLFKEFHLYYYYFIPELSWVESYLNYFEKRFNLKIIRVPNPVLYKLLNNGSLQFPLTFVSIDKLFREGLRFPEYDLTLLMKAVKLSLNLPEKNLCAVGVKASDSPIRKMAIEKHGIINKNTKKWYPIHDYTNKDIVEIMNRHDVPLPEDYDLFGLTFDGLDYRFIKIIKEKKPKDYEKIKYYFPLIDLVLYRHENYWKNQKPKKARFQPYIKYLKIHYDK